MGRSAKIIKVRVGCWSLGDQSALLLLAVHARKYIDQPLEFGGRIESNLDFSLTFSIDETDRRTKR